MPNLQHSLKNALLRTVLGTLLGLLVHTASIAQQKIALVIGNSEYPVGKLSSPKLDAEKVAEKLRSLDYDVTLRTDLSKVEFQKEISKFAQQLSLSKESMGVFYYSGHGMQVGGQNYLIPIDSNIVNDVDVELYAVRLDEVLIRMKAAKSNPSIVILDACRDNPFEKRIKGLQDGLARPVTTPNGTLIAFAAAPGATAPQALGGALSPYTFKLLELIDSDVPFLVMFQNVANEVYKVSVSAQSPHVETSAGLNPSLSLRGTKVFRDPLSPAQPYVEAKVTQKPSAPSDKAQVYISDKGINSFLNGNKIPIILVGYEYIKNVKFDLEIQKRRLVISNLKFTVDLSALDAGDHSWNMYQMRKGEPFSFVVVLQSDYSTGGKLYLHDSGILCCQKFPQGQKVVNFESPNTIYINLSKPLGKAELSAKSLQFWFGITTKDGELAGGYGVEMPLLLSGQY